MKQQYI